jgi:hypothetical protein
MGWGKGLSSSTSGGLMISRQMISSPSASDPASTITCHERGPWVLAFRAERVGQPKTLCVRLTRSPAECLIAFPNRALAAGSFRPVCHSLQKAIVWEAALVFVEEQFPEGAQLLRRCSPRNHEHLRDR